MTNKERDNKSKFLSLILRHKPEDVGLQLDIEGWANTDEILKILNITIKDLIEVVELNDKKRFSFSPDLVKIRAVQGHSIEVDLNLNTAIPPEILFHGTANKNIVSILENGIHKRSRNYVHLSDNVETAIEVGKRYGQPVVFEVCALEMYNSGKKFYISENNVWLTEFVPAIYVRLLEFK